jgi:hypothetical protein
MRRHSLIFRLGGGDRSRMEWVEPSSTRTQVDLVDSKGKLSHGIGDTLDGLAKLGITPSVTGVDLLLISSAVYAADKRVNRATEAQDSWTREIDLHIPVADPHTWTTVAPALQKMLQFLTGDRWRLFFRLSPKKYRNLAREAASPATIITSCCLFSGGLDSFIGAIDLFHTGESPLLVSHGWVASDSKHQQQCLDALTANFTSVSIRHLRSRIGFPEDLIRDSEPERTERSRSFLFFSLAALAVSGVSSQTKIYIPENALISLNIPLDPLRLGAFSTRTTHPFYVARFNEMLASVGISSELHNPYQYMTKGEMVVNCKDQLLLQKSHSLTMSCSSASKARWKGLPPSHCGHCVPCIIRRAALAMMSISDATVYVTDLHARTLNSTKAEGSDIRSFQFAIHRLRNEPNRARVLIHQSGPLTDYPAEIEHFAEVYLRGLQEVERFLIGVKSSPNV